MCHFDYSLDYKLTKSSWLAAETTKLNNMKGTSVSKSKVIPSNQHKDKDNKKLCT